MEILARVLDGLGIGGQDRRRPGRLPRDPRLPRAAHSARRRARRSRRSRRRSRRCWRARARPRSRSSGRARAGASMPTGCCRSRPDPGVTEAEASLRAGHEATLALLASGRWRRRGPARVRGRRAGRLPGPDRPAQRVGARDRPQHRVPRRRRPRHRDERADLGLQRRARARDGDRPADRPHAVAVRPRRRGAAGRVRGAAAGRHAARTSTAR